MVLISGKESGKSGKVLRVDKEKRRVVRAAQHRQASTPAQPQEPAGRRRSSATARSRSATSCSSAPPASQSTGSATGLPATGSKVTRLQKCGERYDGDRVMACAAPRLRAYRREYQDRVVPELVREFRYNNAMEVPRVEKIVVNIGLGEAIQNARAIDAAVDDIKTMTGQAPIVIKARKSVAAFKLRAGMPIGVKVTLRAERMWYFLDKLINVALPRIRDFRGVDPRPSTGMATTPWASGSSRSSRRSTTTRSTSCAGSRSASSRAPRPTKRGGLCSAHFGMPFRKVDVDSWFACVGSRRYGATRVLMAKKSLIVKSLRAPRYSTQQHHRCVRCGRPRGLHAQVRHVPHLLPGAGPAWARSRGSSKSSWREHDQPTPSPTC